MIALIIIAYIYKKGWFEKGLFISGLVYSWVAGKFLLLPDIWNESAENN